MQTPSNSRRSDDASTGLADIIGTQRHLPAHWNASRYQSILENGPEHVTSRSVGRAEPLFARSLSAGVEFLRSRCTIQSH